MTWKKSDKKQIKFQWGCLANTDFKLLIEIVRWLWQISKKTRWFIVKQPTKQKLMISKYSPVKQEPVFLYKNFAWL